MVIDEAAEENMSRERGEVVVESQEIPTFKDG